MQMASADQTTYPKFTQYVRFSMPKLVDVPVIVNALRNIGQINLARMRLVLKWGSGPMLKIGPLPGKYGEFTPDIGSNEISLNERTVKAFEDGRGLVTASAGKVYLVGVVMLHELVHWGDDQDGVDRPGEEGKEFETAVYGSAITDTLFPGQI